VPRPMTDACCCDLPNVRSSMGAVCHPSPTCAERVAPGRDLCIVHSHGWHVST